MVYSCSTPKLPTASFLGFFIFADKKIMITTCKQTHHISKEEMTYFIQTNEVILPVG